MLFVLTSYIRQKEIMRRKKEKDWIFSFSILLFVVIVTLPHHCCLLASPLLVSLNAENEYDNKYDPYYPVKIVCKLPKILSRILHNFLYLNCLTSFIYKAERDYEKEKDWIFSFSTLFFVIVTLLHHCCLLASPLPVS